MAKQSAELRTVFKHDWTTAENLAAELRGKLRLTGYGTEFQIFRNGIPIDEGTARLTIINEITTPPVVGGYQQSLRRMMRDDPGLRDRPMSVGVDPAGGLVFEHGGFQRPVDLDGLEIVAAGQRRKRGTKKEARKEEREQKLRWKLSGTRNANEADYFSHAYCCGYLARNTAIRFNSSGRNQWGTSVTTRIGGIAPPALLGFIDSAGKATLSAIDVQLSEYVDAANGRKVGIEAMYRGFAREVVDFLNLELVVDIDGIARQYKKRLDSKFQTIEHWAGDRKTVLRNLTERRADLDPRKIEMWFERGYALRSWPVRTRKPLRRSGETP